MLLGPTSRSSTSSRYLTLKKGSAKSRARSISRASRGCRPLLEQLPDPLKRLASGVEHRNPQAEALQLPVHQAEGYLPHQDAVHALLAQPAHVAQDDPVVLLELPRR